MCDTRHQTAQRSHLFGLDEPGLRLPQLLQCLHMFCYIHEQHKNLACIRNRPVSKGQRASERLLCFIDNRFVLINQPTEPGAKISRQHVFNGFLGTTDASCEASCSGIQVEDAACIIATQNRKGVGLGELRQLPQFGLSLS